MTINKTIKTIAAVAALAVGAGANAGPVYEYERGAGNFGGAGGEYGFDSIFAQYDTNDQSFTWEVDYAAGNAPREDAGNGSDAATGGWLVINPGGNPKRSDNELAILYFDRSSNSVWAYAYNGLNSSNSWETTEFLGHFENAYQTERDVATLSINVAGINAALETGVQFDTTIGIWLHPAFGGTSANIGENGELTGFSFKDAVWYDTNGEDAVNVAAPATLALLGMGLMGLGARRRKLV